MDAAYASPVGTVTPFDIVYSHRMVTGRDKPFMAHHCGFTLKVLIGTNSRTFAANSHQNRRVARERDLDVLAVIMAFHVLPIDNAIAT